MKQSEFLRQKKNEIIAFLWATLSILLLTALLTYTPEDIRFEVSTPNSPMHNKVGITGAYLAWGLRFLFGQSSYFFVLLFFFWALSSWSERKGHGLGMRFFSGSIFFVSSCASLALLSADNLRKKFDGGGLIGFYLANVLQDLFGNAAIYIAFSLFVLSILLATEFLVFPIVVAVFKMLRGIVAEMLMSKASKENARAVSSRAGDKTEPKAKPVIKLSSSASPVRTEPEAKKTPLLKSLLASKEAKIPEAPAVKKPGEPVIRSLIPKADVKPKTPPPAPKPVVTNRGDYILPGLDLLQDPIRGANPDSKQEIEEQSRILEQTLMDFGIEAKVVEIEQGPSITRFELMPASGVKVQRIVGLTDNIALAMQATSVRVVAPIPGKARVGIEVPNRVTSLVTLKELLTSNRYQTGKSKLMIAIGKDAAGEAVVADLDAMPHLLIAGSTGSGKTVCVNTIILSLLHNATPDEAKLILVDPKKVELPNYNGIPHLMVPVVTENDKVPGVLTWLVAEMEHRYRTLSDMSVRNITGYNEKLAEKRKNAKDGDLVPAIMPYIVVVIDELADLMMSARKEIESTITRLAQLARAVGIHLVLATQRPSVDVITGVIKANFPARISFQVASKVDSRTVLDENGAETLLGKGDLLFMDPAKPKPIRAQGAYVSDKEIDRTVEFIKKQRQPEFNEELLKTEAKKASKNNQDFRGDEFYPEACKIIVSSGQASVSMLQRRLGLGYTRAARLVDMMEEDGIVGPHRGAKPREILITLEALEQRIQNVAVPSPQSPSTPQGGEKTE